MDAQEAKIGARVQGNTDAAFVMSVGNMQLQTRRNLPAIIREHRLAAGMADAEQLSRLRSAATLAW